MLPDLLKYQEEDHKYFWKGEQVPSVTQILEDAGQIDTTWFTQFSRDRGTAAHLAIKLYLAGELDEASVDKHTKPYFSAFKKFMQATKIRVYRFEQMVYSKRYGYAGTFDLYGLMQGKRWVIDFKTGKAFDWVALQLAGYKQAAKESGLKPNKRASVELRKDGTFRFNEHQGFGDLARFLVCLEKARTS